MGVDGTVSLVGRPRHSLAGAFLPLAAVLVPLSILAFVGWLSWQSVWEDARSEMRRSAESAAEYGARALESYSVAAGRVNDRLRGLADTEIRRNERALHEELQRMDAELLRSELSYVIDRQGFALLASNLFPVPRDVSLADREYFKALSGSAPPAVHVSQTFVGRFDGRLLFSVSRRRRDTGNPATANGFDGVVLVSVSPHVLADGMRRLLAAPTDRMALVREDGYGISTTSGLLDQGQPLPRVQPDSPFHGFAASGARSAIYLSSTAMTGTTALLAMRRIEGFPVYAVSLRPSAEIVGRWWQIMATQLGFGIPATLGLLLLSLRVHRDQRRLAAVHADLRSDHDLSTGRLERAKRFGLIGTFEFDLRTGISRRSPEYMSVHGLPAVAADETHADWARRLHPDDRERAERHLAEVLAAGSGATHYEQTYRIITAAGEVRWIAARGVITRDEAGRAVMLLGAHVDVTPTRTTELALAESDARLRLAQEAVGIGTWEWSWVARKLLLSRQAMDLLGRHFANGTADIASTAARVHPLDHRRVARELARARRTGHFQSEFRVLRPIEGGKAATIWVMARARLLTTEGGGGHRMMGVAYDVTNRKLAEMEAALLAHEVEHRAKNTLAIVAALVRVSAAKDLPDFVEVLQGRIMALARATTLLGQRRWNGADIRDLIEQELAPFAITDELNGSRILQLGPSILLGAEQVQPFSMAVHELATNAVKYGALSSPAGRLELRWARTDNEVHLEWSEHGGPTVNAPPAHGGFGSRLIRQVFEDQLRGTIAMSWDAQGFSCRVSFPAAQSANPEIGDTGAGSADNACENR